MCSTLVKWSPVVISLLPQRAAKAGCMLTTKTTIAMKYFGLMFVPFFLCDNPALDYQHWLNLA
jgi:hypothetical protein